MWSNTLKSIFVTLVLCDRDSHPYGTGRLIPMLMDRIRRQRLHHRGRDLDATVKARALEMTNRSRSEAARPAQLRGAVLHVPRESSPRWPPRPPGRAGSR